MLHGVLIAESLRLGAEVNGIPLRVTRVRRVETESAAEYQPRCWTLLDFSADPSDADRLAEQLAAALDPVGGWYADFHTPDDSFVVFAGTVFRYPRGQAEGRRAAQEHGRAVGVPEPQLDWHA